MICAEMTSTNMTLVMTTSGTMLMSVRMSMLVPVLVITRLWLGLWLSILPPTPNTMTPESVDLPEMWSSL